MSDTSWNDTLWNSEPASSGEGTKFCPHCGEKIPYSASFCPFCGSRFETVLKEPESDSDEYIVQPLQPEPDLTSPYVTDYAEPVPVKKKKNIPVIIAAVAAMIAAALIGFLIIAPRIAGRGTENTSESAEQVTENQTVQAEAQTAGEDVQAEAQTAGKDVQAEGAAAGEKAAEPLTEVMATPIPTATATPIPTATPTPTEAPQQIINPVNVVDPSTGQLINIPNDTATSYAYPDSGSRVWSYGDVNGMTAGQVRYCINEIYARNGYIFVKDVWLNYFRQKTWYSPTIPAASFSDSNLSSTDLANVNLLNRYYSDMHYENYD